jgi:hypothetical protein
MRAVRTEVFAQESAAGGARREQAVVAFETAPFGKMVGQVEGGRRRGGVFVVDEGGRFDGWLGGCSAGPGLDDDVAGKEVAVAEDELERAR